MPDNELQTGNLIPNLDTACTSPDITVTVEVQNVPITFTIKPSGEVTCDWWTPEAGKIMCTLCGKNGKEPDITDLLNPEDPCHLCLNRNAYCG